VDQRLVRDGHIRRCGPDALALYLFLVTVADARGLSFYADASVGRQVSLTPEPLARARAELVATGLIAREPPLYQVLALDPPPVGAGRVVAIPQRARHGAPRSLAACLRQALEETP
jgi:hypothetical protein